MGVYPKPFTDVMNVSVGELTQARGPAQDSLETADAMNPLNWSVVVPEIVLLVMACVIAVVDLFVTIRGAA